MPYTRSLSGTLQFHRTDMRVLTGITTSGIPHLGNYVGAIRPALAASRGEGVDAFYFMADYHALIKCDDPARVQHSRLAIAASWLAAGLDPRAGDDLPPVGHPRDPRADLAADLRHRQGPAQSRARLQGGGGRQHRVRRGSGCRRHRGPVHVPGADGRRHPGLQRAQGAGRARPGAAHRDGARHRAALQPPLRARVLRAARGGDRGAGGHAAGPGRAQDVQELRQHHPAVRGRGQGHARGDHAHRHRLARARRAQGCRRLGAVHHLPRLRRADGDRRVPRRPGGRPGLGRGQAAPVRAHRDASWRRCASATRT